MAKKRGVAPNVPLSESDQALMAFVRASGTRATCFFNNKGGVGKTTLVANLAAELALNFKAKVLVVDADPQCNLTQYVLGEEETFRIYSEPNPEGVYTVIRPLSLGKGYGSHLPSRA